MGVPRAGQRASHRRGLFFERDGHPGRDRPILLPMAERFGIDLVHFGIMVIANLGIGYVTPPVGTCLYVACSISKEPLDRVIRPLVPLLLVMTAMLAVVAFVPEITLLVRGGCTEDKGTGSGTLRRGTRQTEDARGAGP